MHPARKLAIAAAERAGVADRIQAVRLKLLWPRDLVVRTPPPCPPGWVTGPPDYVGVGVQKAGTSWWHRAITAHPRCYRTKLHKELHFFDQGWHQDHAQKPEDYHLLFPRPPGSVTGEWTPDYLADFWFPQAIAQAAPGARLLVMLRDPVSRFESGVTHTLAHGGRVHPIVAVQAEARGYYHRQLTALMRHVPRDQVLVLQYEKVRDDPAPHLAATYRFLDLDDSFRPDGLDSRVNENPGPRYRLAEAQRRQLTDVYADDVAALARDFPEVDVTRWKHFARL